MKERINLCPICEINEKVAGHLNNMAVDCTNGNRCDICSSKEERCTRYMDAAERAAFDAAMKEKSDKLLKK